MFDGNQTIIMIIAPGEAIVTSRFGLDASANVIELEALNFLILTQWASTKFI